MHIVRYCNAEGDDNIFSFSKPCSHCLNMLLKFGIRKVKYTLGDGKTIEMKTNQIKTSHESMAYRQLKKHCSI